MTEDDIDRALEKGFDAEEPRRAVAKTVVDHNVEHIQRLINELRNRESRLEQVIGEQMDDLRATRRTIAIYVAALRGLS